MVGPNGAGKTTMLDIITGKTRPDEGRVVWGEDTDLTRLDEADCARLGIGRKFQKPTVFETLSVEENLMLALAGERGVAATLLHRLTGGEAARIDELLALVRPRRGAGAAGGQPQPRAEAVAGDRHAAGAGPAAPAGGRAGGGHDRRRDHAHGGAPAQDRRQAFGAW